MTISSEIRKAGPFTGNSATSVYPFAFKVFAESDIMVVIADLDGAETTWALDTNYSVTLNADQDASPGGSITLLGGSLATGYKLVIIGDVANLQGTDLTNQGGFYPQVIEDALDRATIQIQQIAEEMERSVRVPATSDVSLEELTKDLINVAADLTNVNIVATNISDVNDVADNMADVNTVADNLADVTNFADVYQGPKVTAPTTRNDASALVTGDLYFDTAIGYMRAYDGTAWQTIFPMGVVDQEFSATAAQTTFTVTDGYNPDFVFVYLNGALLAGEDYTATDGDDVVLDTGVALDDVVRVVSFLSIGTAVDSILDVADRFDTGAFDAAVAAAAVSAGAAETAETNAETAEANAAISESNAAISESNAEAAQALAESARDAALLSRGLWQTTAQGIGQGVAGTDSLVAGSGGTDGAFDLAFSGGTQVIAPKGYFVVAGGAVTQVAITYAGHYSAGTPTLSFAASAGLTGASATAVMGANTPVDAYFSVPVAGSNDSLILYKVTTGPAATEITRYASSNAVLKPTYAGKYNGWEDPFFRRTGLNEVVRNRVRYYADGMPITSLEFSTNTPFNGRALRKNSSGTGNLAGPRIYLDEIGATAGDTITIRALVVGDGASAIFPSRGVSASGAPIGTQFTSTPSSITTSSTPTLVTATIATEALTESVWFYPYTNTAGKTFDIVALWVYKGVAADGPSWPLFGEDAYLLNKVVESDDALATLEDEVDLNTTKLAGLSSEATVVTAASTAVNLTVTSPVLDFQYGSPFSGWGEAYTPAGIDFNAVRVRYLARKEADTTLAQQWSYMHVVVRTGANAHLASAPVVAVGVVKIPAAKASLANITILLRDPVTNALITLNDASFSGGEYFVGVYARTLSGSPASMSYHRAAQANSKGQSYYITTANPLTAAWAENYNNVRVGVDHLLMVSPVESSAYTLNQAVIADAFASLPAPEMVMPPTIYGVQGRECNVYLDNLHLGNSSDYLHDVTSVSALGQQQNERWTWIPTAALASGSLSVTANDKRTGTALVTKTSQQRAAASTAGSGTNKKVLVIGDSLVNAGVITQTLLDIAATDVMDVTLLGTLGTGVNLHEGRGGWTIAAYTSAYTYPPYGLNPFWIGGEVNFPQYLVDNSLATPDWVVIHLGINDCFSYTTDANVVDGSTAAFNSLDVLIASIKAAGAGVNVALMLPSPPSFDQDSFGANYSSGQTKWRFKRNILIWARQLLLKYAGQEASRIYVVPSNVALDTVNNMSRAGATPVNSRSAITVQRQNNGVHPATSGYQQIGDALWAFLKYYA